MALDPRLLRLLRSPPRPRRRSRFSTGRVFCEITYRVGIFATFREAMLES